MVVWLNHFNLIDKGHSHAGCHSSHVGLKERNSPGQVNRRWAFYLRPVVDVEKNNNANIHRLGGRGNPNLRVFLLGFLDVLWSEILATPKKTTILQTYLESLPWLKDVLSSPIILYLSGVATNQNREYNLISEASESAQKHTFSQHWKQPSENGRFYKSSTKCFWNDYW